MKKYCLIIDKEEGTVDVALGNDEEYYISLGMKKRNVEQSKDGTWYLKGKAKAREISLETKLLKMEEVNMMPRWQRDIILAEGSTYPKTIRLKAKEIEDLAIEYRKQKEKEVTE